MEPKEALRRFFNVHWHVCEHCAEPFECDGKNCDSIYAYVPDGVYLCENCQECEHDERAERKLL